MSSVNAKIQDTVTTIQIEQATMKANANEQSEKIDKVDAKVDKVDAKVDALDQKLDSVLKTLDTFSGGKNVLLWLAGIAGTIALVVVTWIGIHHK